MAKLRERYMMMMMMMTKSHYTDLNVATHFAAHPRLETGYVRLCYKKKLSLNVRVGQNETNYIVITKKLTLFVIM